MLNPRKQIDRIGCEPVKYAFSIQVAELVVPKDTNIPEGALLSVCFERGSKISSTKNKPFFQKSCSYERSSGTNLSETKYRDNFSVRNKLIFSYDEKIELVATLYRDIKTGKFLEKKSKVILRQHMRNKIFSVDTYQGMGLYNMKLDELAMSLGFDSIKSTVMQLPLMYMKESRLNVIVTVSILRNKSLAVDDCASIASYTSDMSTLGATFSFDSDKVFDSELPFEFNNAGNIDKLRSMSFSSVDDDPTASGTPGNKCRRLSRSIETEEANSNKPPSYSSYRKESAPNSGDSNSMHLQSPPATSTPSNAAATTAANPKKSIMGFSRSPPPPPTPTPANYEESKAKELQNVLMTRQDERIKSNEETIRLYQQELENRALRIKRLEMQLSMQSDQIYTLKKEASQKKISSPTSESTASPTTSTSTTISSDDASSHLHLPSVDDNNVTLTAALRKAKEDLAVMAAEHNRTAAELSAMTETMLRYKAVAEDAVQEKEDETLAAQEAASAAVTANMRRAELDVEIANVISELIDYKMKCANMALELETERKKRFVTKARLQQYAELEILNVNMNFNDDDDTAINGFASPKTKALNLIADTAKHDHFLSEVEKDLMLSSSTSREPVVDTDKI